MAGAISAGAAQAANWTVGTENPIAKSYNIKPAATVTTPAGFSSAVIELTVPGLGITLSSTGLTVNGGEITPTASGKASSLSFTGATETEAAGCRVGNVCGTFGTITTAGLAPKDSKTCV